MRPFASHILNVLSRQLPLTGYVTAPQQGSGLWKKLMSRCIQSKIKVTKCQLTVLLFEKLKCQNQGTNEIEHYVKKMKNNKTRSNIRRSILGHKIRDAYAEKVRAVNDFNRNFRYLERKIGWNFNIFIQFKDVMQSEIENIWEQGRQKNKKSTKQTSSQSNKTKGDQPGY